VSNRIFLIQVSVLAFVLSSSGLLAGIALRANFVLPSATFQIYLQVIIIATFLLCAVSGFYKEKIRDAALAVSPFILWIFLSSLWSEFPLQVVTKSVSTTMTVLFCAALIASKNERVLVSVIAYFSIICCSISLLMFLSGLGSVTGLANNMFVGLFVHKAILADIAAVCVFFGLYRVSQGRLLGAALILTLGFLVLWLAGHWTTIGAVLIVVLLYIFPILIKPSLVLIVFVAASLPMIDFDFGIFADFLTFLDRNVTFSNRTYLWAVGKDQFFKNALLGNGYFNIRITQVWQDLPIFYRNSEADVAPHLHNLWIETMFMFGLIGFSFLVYVTVIFPCIQLSIAKTRDKFLLLGFVFFAVLSAMEVPLYTTRLQSIAFFMLIMFTLVSSKESLKNLPVSA
jgi:O-antigen ligase